MNKENNVYVGLVIGVSMMMSTWIISQTFLSVKRMDNIISVSGSAKQKVVADSARWTGNFSRVAGKDNLKEGYAQMKADEKVIGDFLVGQGFDKGSVEISPVYMSEVYKSDANAPKEYTLTQTVAVGGSDVQKMKALAKMSDQIAEQGMIFSANSVEYNYSKLAELRVSLLPEAIKDAKARAEQIAKSSGKNVDSIKSVTMGVVQVMPAGTQDVSDYGSYDTTSIDKEVMITVKTVFGLK